MKVKELIKRLQSLDQELDAYIWNEKEHSLFLVEDVRETSDFGENEKGENEWEDFVTIFPKNNSQPLFTLPAEDVNELKNLLDYLNTCCRNEIVRNVKETQDDYFLVRLYANISNRTDNMLNRINQWKEI